MSIAASIHERVHRRWVFDRRRERLATALLTQLPPASSVLDVGCGSGEVGADLTAAGHVVVGVETHERASCAIPLAVYDGVRLPFADGDVDWAVIVDVLHHAADPVRVVREAARVSRCGLVVKDHYAESTRQRLTLGVMDWVGNRQFGVGRDGRYLSRDEWSELWAECGLEVSAVDESLDLYPTAVKPIFETGLHFVARVVPEDGPVSG